MSDKKIETVRSVSVGDPGRAVSSVRGQQLVLDSSSHPRDDALTNSEAFLAGISSCGVTLIEGHARDEGIPVSGMSVQIEGVRTPSSLPASFERVSMRFEIAGVESSTGADREQRPGS